MAKDDSKYILNEEFLNELLRMCFRRKEVMDSCVLNLKFQYIPSEPYKEIFKTIKNHYVHNNTLPSFGTVHQSIQSSLGKKANITLEVLTDIKNTEIVNVAELLRKFEIFIKDSMSVEFFNEFGEKYKSGDRDAARALMMSASEKINNFSVFKGTGVFHRVFGGFHDRDENRKDNLNIDSATRYKLPFSIDELDQMSYGGCEPSDTFCMVMRSGIGKTKFLRHVGVGAVRRGMNILHLQAEGSKESCLNGYDATWTACLMSDIKKGSIDPTKYKELNKVVSAMKAKGSDIYVHAFEQFGRASMNDVRNLHLDMLKLVPHVHGVLSDYLELFDPADGIRYTPDQERHRRLAVANKQKNLAVEFGSVYGTCTQANDIAPKLLQDPEFYMTRHNVSECKGLVNPFSFYMTGNQTSEERKENQMRIYTDKFRDYPADRIVTIYQDYDHDRFYNKRKTLQALISQGKEE